MGGAVDRMSFEWMKANAGAFNPRCVYMMLLREALWSYKLEILDEQGVTCVGRPAATPSLHMQCVSDHAHARVVQERGVARGPL
jgi:hypothetical protein